jgi:oxygen-independent coproporphyrinogen-3 oxidase
MELRKDELQNELVETIYFGGGTPSLLTANELHLLTDSIYKYFRVSVNPEITLEANPDDLSKAKIEMLAKSPINRLSIGIQSFFEEDLKKMNRAHNASEARECLAMANAFFDNISIDLIYGIPNMPVEKWDENLQMAFRYNAQHISSYALTVEPNTALASFIKKGSYPPMDEALALAHFTHLISETEKQGFVHYEISNFGKPAFFSKHNTSYWKGKTYLGIGPSAHSFKAGQRSWNISNNSKYIQSILNKELPSEVELLSVKDQYNEYIMTGLRTIWGVSLDYLTTCFGIQFTNDFIKASQKFLNEGLLVMQDDAIVVSKKGKFLVDGIASELFLI